MTQTKLTKRPWVRSATLSHGGVAAISGKKNQVLVALAKGYAFRDTLGTAMYFDSVADAVTATAKHRICILAAMVAAARYVAPMLEIRRGGSTTWERHATFPNIHKAREYAVNDLGVEI